MSDAKLKEQLAHCQQEREREVMAAYRATEERSEAESRLYEAARKIRELEAEVEVWRGIAAAAEQKAAEARIQLRLGSGGTP